MLFVMYAICEFFYSVMFIEDYCALTMFGITHIMRLMQYDAIVNMKGVVFMSVKNVEVVFD